MKDSSVLKSRWWRTRRRARGKITDFVEKASWWKKKRERQKDAKEVETERYGGQDEEGKEWDSLFTPIIFNVLLIKYNIYNIRIMRYATCNFDIFQWTNNNVLWYISSRVYLITHYILYCVYKLTHWMTYLQISNWVNYLLNHLMKYWLTNSLTDFIRWWQIDWLNHW